MEQVVYHASYQPPEVILAEGLLLRKSRFYPEDPKIFLAASWEECKEYGPYLYAVQVEGLEIEEESGYLYVRKDIPATQITRFFPPEEEEE